MKVSWASPRAARMRSRSRAVSTVPTKGKMLALSSWHWAANSWSLWSSAATAAGVVGTGSISCPPVPDPVWLAQLTGLLRCTPRGSKETMSKRSSSPGVSTDSSLGRSSIPEVPGPPGLMTIDPIRSDGSSAGCRATAICRVGPSGLS